MSLKAGSLNQRLELQSREIIKDPAGGPVELWTTFATVWCMVEPLRGQLLDVAQQTAAEADTRFTIRYRTDLAPDTRLLFDGIAYDIVWRDILGLNEGIEILARRLDPQPEQPDELIDFDDDEIVDFDGDLLLLN